MSPKSHGADTIQAPSLGVASVEPRERVTMVAHGPRWVEKVRSTPLTRRMVISYLDERVLTF
eukprot:2382746-Pyramimonas_sp.AAC.3